MKCIEFKKWLYNRETFERKLHPSAKAHIKTCSSCRKLNLLDKELDNIVNKEFLAEEVPPGVVHRIEADLQQKSNSGVFSNLYIQKLAPAVAISFIALFFTLFYLPGDFNNLQHISNAAVEYHLKSEHGMTFKENNILKGNKTLNEELGFKVVIPDLSTQGYQLLGGRKCVLEKRDVAYIFYEKQGHINSLFILNQNDLGFEMTDGAEYKDVNKGCPINIWKENSQVYALVN